MDIKESLISRRNSTLVKGFLILLIILGHNGVLMGKHGGTTPNILNDYLYSFHVYCFFMLAFLYDIPKFTYLRVKKDFITLMKPYFILIIVLLSYKLWICKHYFDAEGTLWAVVTANQGALKEYVGAYFPWFLPSFFTILLMRNYVLPHKWNWLKIFVFSISVVFLLMKVSYSGFRLGDNKLFICGSYVAITYFSLTVVARLVYANLRNNRFFGVVVALAFVISSICFFSINVPQYVANMNAHIILPISAFFFIVVIVDRLPNNILTTCLTYIGRISLPLYMIHIFVENALLLIAKRFVDNLSIGIGILILMFTIVLSLLIIKLLDKFNVSNLILK